MAPEASRTTGVVHFSEGVEEGWFEPFEPELPSVFVFCDRDWKTASVEQYESSQKGHDADSKTNLGMVSGPNQDSRNDSPDHDECADEGLHSTRISHRARHAIAHRALLTDDEIYNQQDKEIDQQQQVDP